MREQLERMLKKRAPVGAMATEQTGRERLVCLAGHCTQQMVARCCDVFGLTLVCCSTLEEARRECDADASRTILVAALGTKPGVDTIFEADDSSTLLAHAKAAGMCTFVFSHTACRDRGTMDACISAGARAVVDSEAKLTKVLHACLWACDGSGREVQRTYRPVRDKLQRVRALRQHGQDASADGVHRMIARLTAQLRRLPEPLTRCESGRPRVRFACVSDTHGEHRQLELPADADVLVHAGDFLANYGHADEEDGLRDLERQLEDFRQWLQHECAHFKRVVLVAGNHDTLLDAGGGRHCGGRGAAARRKFLARLPESVVYLENEAAEVCGVRVWGGPFTACRKERLGKRYYSDGFERPAAQRRAAYEQAVGELDGVDVLVTHCPPRGVLSGPSADEELSRALSQLQRPPRFHVFGHDHDHVGVAYNERPNAGPSNAGPAEAAARVPAGTVSVNAAQQTALRLDPDGGGFALVFDV
jgi:hypothetical protein